MSALIELTPQEAFDKVAVHLLTQNEKSIDDKGNWACRGLNGCKCAIGALIPDEEFDSIVLRCEKCDWWHSPLDLNDEFICHECKDAR